MTTRVVLGNRHATDSPDNGETRHALPKGKRATTIDIPDEVSLTQALIAITTKGGVWDTHTATREKGADPVSNDKAVPAWVASDDPALASVLAAHFGGIEIRDLEEN